jgi:hypothetical protein
MALRMTVAADVTAYQEQINEQDNVLAVHQKLPQEWLEANNRPDSQHNLILPLRGVLHCSGNKWNQHYKNKVRRNKPIDVGENRGGIF